MASSSSKSDDEQSLVSSGESQVANNIPQRQTVDGNNSNENNIGRKSSKLKAQPDVIEYDDEKAAMDFGLTKGKILNPNELKAVLKEQQHLRPTAKIRLHSPDTRLQTGVYANQLWFRNDMSRDDAVIMINSWGCKEGLFLIRVSDRLPGCYVLSLAHGGSVLHYPISLLKNEKGLTLMTLDGGRTKFKDLFQLVDFYEINCGHLPVVLQQPCSSFRSDQAKSNDGEPPTTSSHSS